MSATVELEDNSQLCELREVEDSQLCDDTSPPLKLPTRGMNGVIDISCGPKKSYERVTPRKPNCWAPNVLKYAFSGIKRQPMDTNGKLDNNLAHAYTKLGGNFPPFDADRNIQFKLDSEDGESSKKSIDEFIEHMQVKYDIDEVKPKEEPYFLTKETWNDPLEPGIPAVTIKDLYEVYYTANDESDVFMQLAERFAGDGSPLDVEDAEYIGVPSPQMARDEILLTRASWIDHRNDYRFYFDQRDGLLFADFERDVDEMFAVSERLTFAQTRMLVGNYHMPTLSRISRELLSVGRNRRGPVGERAIHGLMNAGLALDFFGLVRVTDDVFMLYVRMWLDYEEALIDNNEEMIPITERIHISNWDVALVTHMYGAFKGAETFNQPLSKWHTNQVTNMCEMFSGAWSFNQPLNSEWNTANVTNMSFMFHNAIAFDQPIVWDTEKVTDMKGMFSMATQFNQSLENFNVINVKNMRNMFFLATNFNGSLNGWKTVNVESMSSMFRNAIHFNQPLEWNVKKVKDMRNMFFDAERFNASLDGWETDEVENMSGMFHSAVQFNQPLEKWNVEKVKDMSEMFKNAKSFDKSISEWKLTNIIEYSRMFDDPIRYAHIMRRQHTLGEN
jgi:hypothetical protein